MKKYELMYIVKPDVETEEVKKVIETLSKTVTDLGSMILEHKEMGLKPLAYEIEKHKKGYYVWQLIEATPEAVDEFNRIARFTEEVIRWIVVKEGE